MKRIFLFGLLLCLWAPCLAQLVNNPVITLDGYIIDNACAESHKDHLAEFVKTHTKECALSPRSVESGYSLFAYGELLGFDKASNTRIFRFLKLAASKLRVEVVVNKTGDELQLISIKTDSAS